MDEFEALALRGSGVQQVQPQAKSPTSLSSLYPAPKVPLYPVASMSPYASIGNTNFQIVGSPLPQQQQQQQIETQDEFFNQLRPNMAAPGVGIQQQSPQLQQQILLPGNLYAPYQQPQLQQQQYWMGGQTVMQPAASGMVALQPQGQSVSNAQGTLLFV